jgi:hypothetical protein
MTMKSLVVYSMCAAALVIGWDIPRATLADRGLAWAQVLAEPDATADRPAPAVSMGHSLSSQPGG